MTNFVAIDPGTKFGWATGTDGKKNVTRYTRSGVLILPSRPEGKKGNRWSYLDRHLNWIATQGWASGFGHGPKFELWYERPGNMRAMAIRDFWGQVAIIQHWCDQHDVTYHPVAPSTIKKSFTGFGFAPKPSMIRVAREFGHIPVDDNEADAIALLYHARGYRANSMTKTEFRLWEKTTP